MSRSKIVLVGGTIIAVAILLLAASPQAFLRPQAVPETATTQPTSTVYFPTAFPLGNAFAPFNNVLPSPTNSYAGAANQTPTFQGKPVTSLSDVANIVNAAPAGASAPSAAQLLPLPSVPDSEIAIDPSGTSAIEDYVAYANGHSGDIAFTASQFNGVLKDGNGVLLFPPDLTEQALVSGDFAAIHNSLATYQKYYTAKIVFEKSIKVTGDAVALNKKVIGFDELTMSLIQKDLDVEAGRMSTSSLKGFYEAFISTADADRQELLREAGVIAAVQPNLWDELLALLGLAPNRANAQSSVLPFGGRIGLPLFCTCNVGYLISVSSPKPPTIGSLYVPIWFLSTTLFYQNRSLVPGTWWLGLYLSTTISCLQLPYCTFSGIGNEIYMAGTSAS